MLRSCFQEFSGIVPWCRRLNGEEWGNESLKMVLCRPCTRVNQAVDWRVIKYWLAPRTVGIIPSRNACLTVSQMHSAWLFSKSKFLAIFFLNSQFIFQLFKSLAISVSHNNSANRFLLAFVFEYFKFSQILYYFQIQFCT